MHLLLIIVLRRDVSPVLGNTLRTLQLKDRRVNRHDLPTTAAAGVRRPSGTAGDFIGRQPPTAAVAGSLPLP